MNENQYPSHADIVSLHNIEHCGFEEERNSSMRHVNK
jgi:hypothetical protein